MDVEIVYPEGNQFFELFLAVNSNYKLLSILDKLDEFPEGGQLEGPPPLLPHRQRCPKVVPPREELLAEAPHGRRPVPVHYLPPV